MKNKPINEKVILTSGLIGILAAFLTIVSDLILIGKPISGYQYFMLGTENLESIAHWRITFGTFMGVMILPFQLVGIITVYNCLKPSGKVMPWVVSLINAHALIMGVAFHMSYEYFGWGWKLFYKTGTANKMVEEMVNKFGIYWKALIYIMLIELFISSLIHVILIMKGKTFYPKWMAVLNPFCISLFLFPCAFFIPVPIGGYIGSAYLNLSTLISLGLSTIVFYKKSKQQMPSF